MQCIVACSFYEIYGLLCLVDMMLCYLLASLLANAASACTANRCCTGCQRLTTEDNTVLFLSLVINVE